MTVYTIWIKVRLPVILAPIERGNPIRRFQTRTLHEAVALANVALFTAGEAMRKAPRRLQPGGVWPIYTPALSIEITRNHD